MNKSDFIVLVVEDDDGLRETILSILDSDGFGVLAARDGEEALQLYQTEKTHMVLSDIRMPRKSGDELLEEIKKLDLPMNPFFFMSGDAKMSQETARDLGSSGIIHKPQELTDIPNIVESEYQLLMKAC